MKASPPTVPAMTAEPMSWAFRNTSQRNYGSRQHAVPFDPRSAELVDALESGSDPCAFWAKWIDVVIEREPAPETDASPAGWGSE